MNAYLTDPDVTLYHGDAEAVLRELPAASVHMVATSPPFFGLRDYGVQGQIGLESSPEEYVARLVSVFREVRRVLRDDGTLWLNLGDSYNSNESGGMSGSTLSKGGQQTAHNRIGKLLVGLKPKDLLGIPWRVAFALQADGWYLRSDIVWAKPNPMPESVTDRPTKAHEYVFLLSKAPRYYFDNEALREPAQPRPIPSPSDKTKDPNSTGWLNNAYAPGPSGYGHHPNGRNTRSVWTIATQGFPGAHFATFPEELVRRCILAGTSERGVCPECGDPWVREVEIGAQESRGFERNVGGRTDGFSRPKGGAKEWATKQPNRTLGWNPSCDHDAEPVPAAVLDPFVGSGTTCLVARKHGRRSIGIDLSADYLALAGKRLSQLSLLAEATP